MKEQIASGLRQMKTTPEMLLYCGDCGDGIEIPSQVRGIFVVHSSLVSNTTTDLDIPWIPVWFEWEDYILERKRFNEGYEALEDSRQGGN